MVHSVFLLYISWIILYLKISISAHSTTYPPSFLPPFFACSLLLLLFPPFSFSFSFLFTNLDYSFLLSFYFSFIFLPFFFFNFITFSKIFTLEKIYLTTHKNHFSVILLSAANLLFPILNPWFYFRFCFFV